MKESLVCLMQFFLNFFHGCSWSPCNFFVKSVHYIGSIFFFSFLERDAFDALFDNAPEKLNVVKKVYAI